MGSVRLGIDGNLALALRDHFKLKVFIETGSFRGGTCTWAAEHFERVYTIEGYLKRWNGLIAEYGQGVAYPNLEFIFGDSRTKLAELLTRIDEPVLFFLDAHWNGSGAIEAHEIGDECPLRQELDAINAHPFAAQHIVLVDDARLFTAPPPYPHDPQQWPTYAEVQAELLKHPRVITIKDDVIIAIPITPVMFTFTAYNL